MELSEKSQNKNTVNYLKYYHSLEGEKKRNLIKKLTAYKTRSYNTNDEFRNRILAKQKEYENKQKLQNPHYAEVKRIQSYLRLLNLKHKANETIKKNDKMTLYDITFDTNTTQYISNRLIELRKLKNATKDT